MEKSYQEMIDDIEKEYFEYIQSASTYFVAIRNLATDKGELEFAEKMQYEVDVFVLHEKHPLIDRHDKYVRRFDDRIDNFTEKQIDYYCKRLSDSKSMQLKCRYADVLIDYKGKHLKIKKFELLKILVPLLLENAKIHLNQKEKSFEYFEFFRNIARAVEVTLSFNNNDYLITLIDVLNEHFGIISNDENNYRWVLEAAEIIRGIATSRHKDLLPDELTKYSIETLDKVKDWHWAINDHNFHRIFCEEIIEWAKLLKYPPEKIHSYQLEIGKSFEQEAVFQQGRADTSNLVKANFLELALKHYADIGETEKIETIKKQVYDAYVDAQPEFKLVSVPLKLDERQQKEIEGLLDAYRQLTLEKILMLISVDKDLIPNIDRIKKLTEDQASTFTLQSLISKSIVSDGKKVFQPTSDEENFEMSLNSNYMINVQLILELALLPVFNLATEEKGLNADVFLEKLKSWELMNENNFNIISAGVRSFFNEDYISSLHVLVPQFEACVRHMFVKAGAATTSIKKGMAQHEETFNEFLKREDVIQSLGVAVHKYFQFVMVEQSGMNLRNNIAHGLIKAEACNKSINVLVLHLFLVLTIYGLTTN